MVTSTAHISANLATGRGESHDQRPDESLDFTNIYDCYFSRIFAFAYSRLSDEDLALDIASSVFEKAYLKMPSLRQRDAIGSWLFTIARNEMVTYWRKQKPIEQALIAATQDGMPATSEAPEPEEAFLRKERAQALGALVQRLPPREQEVISLKFDAELSNREIAHVLETSETNIRVAIFRALRRLREYIDRDGLYQERICATRTTTQTSSRMQ